MSRSGFYAWRKREESRRSREDAALLEKVRQVHEDCRGVYGSPRVHQALRQQGIRVGRKRVERLMREASLVGRVAKIYRRVPGVERFYRRHKNLRLNTPTPTEINQQWVADLTYIKVRQEWRYLAVVLDVYSRKVIGWSLGSRKTAELTLQALRHALRVRKPAPGLIFHTDRGVEYGAYLIQNELGRHGIRPSMNRPKQCTDNAHMESFFHSMKAEVIHGVSFKDEQELRAVLRGYINHFYNQKRLHSGIGYVAPAEYERLAA